MSSKYNMVCENCTYGNMCPHVGDITEARENLAGTNIFRKEDSPVCIAVHCEGFRSNLVTGRLN